MCDGEYRANPSGRLVIARAGITCEAAADTIILSGGPVRFTHPVPRISNSFIFSASKVEIPPGAKVAYSVIKENQPNALGPVKFFDPAQAGIEVELVKDAVQIKKVDPAKAFARAGLKAGDVLLALDNSPVPSVESFRKAVFAQTPKDFLFPCLISLSKALYINRAMACSGYAHYCFLPGCNSF